MGLVTVAPAEYVAFGVEGEAEVVAGAEVGDSAKVWDEDGVFLDGDDRVVGSEGEAKDSVVVL